MSDDRIFDTLEDFIAEMKNIGVSKIAFAQVNERRAEPLDSEVAVILVVKLELLAYKDAVLYKYIAKDPDLDSIYNSLIEENFEVTKRSRNIS
ncbi:MAG: hypothetical protein GY754_20960 [bacterium]|nr:hypothetical protein [bacterium]